MSTFTYTTTDTFTLTHAKDIASRVAADLRRFTRFYQNPTVQQITNYETELVALLKAGYLKKVIYGFYRNGKWVEALQYQALPDGTLITSDDPGKIRPGTDVPGESFTSHLWKNEKWQALTAAQQTAFYATLPFQRVSTPEMPLESGYWSSDLNYAAGGRGLGRSTIIR